MVSVFLSEDEQDLWIAQELRKYVRRLGIIGYVQSATAGFGKVTLSERIKRAIRDSRLLIPILTPSGASSEWVNQEIGYAEGVGVPVLPLKSEGVTLRGFIEGYKYLKLDLTDLKPVATTLIRALKEELAIEIATGQCPSCLTTVNFHIGNVVLSELDEQRLVLTKKCEKCGSKLQLEPRLLDISLY